MRAWDRRLNWLNKVGMVLFLNVQMAPDANRFIELTGAGPGQAARSGSQRASPVRVYCHGTRLVGNRAMDQTTYVYEGTQANFATLVLENSRKGPVLVNFWRNGLDRATDFSRCLCGLPRSTAASFCW